MSPDCTGASQNAQYEKGSFFNIRGLPYHNQQYVLHTCSTSFRCALYWWDCFLPIYDTIASSNIHSRHGTSVWFWFTQSVQITRNLVLYGQIQKNGTDKMYNVLCYTFIYTFDWSHLFSCNNTNSLDYIILQRSVCLWALSSMFKARPWGAISLGKSFLQ